ncbi:hypothetical protein HPB47_026239, partial [Ixodes persulcatus]
IGNSVSRDTSPDLTFTYNLKDATWSSIDAHLLHLWDARNGLLKRWKTRKTNRKLRIRIAKLTVEAETYACQLSQQNWSQFCYILQGTLGTRRTWHLLRSLMGTKESKYTTAHQLRRLIHNHPGTEQDLIKEINPSKEHHQT